MAPEDSGSPGWGWRLTGLASAPLSELDLQASPLRVPGGSSPPLIVSKVDPCPPPEKPSIPGLPQRRGDTFLHRRILRGSKHRSGPQREGWALLHPPAGHGTPRWAWLEMGGTLTAQRGGQQV